MLALVLAFMLASLVKTRLKGIHKCLNIQAVLSIQRKILGLISGNFQQRMEQHFPEFLEKRTTLQGIPKFSEISYQQFPFHLTFLPEFLELSVEWFAFWKFNHFLIFFSGNFQ